MSILPNLIKSKSFLHLKPTQPSSILSRFFSTAGTEQTPPPLPPPPQQSSTPPPPPTPDSSVNSILQNIIPEVSYARLMGTGAHTLKMDVITFLEGCNLTPQDVKVSYGRYFESKQMILQFHSKNAFDTAARTVINKNRSYRLERVDKSAWDIPSYEGKCVLLSGIPQRALIEDIERFLSGTGHISSRMELLMRDKVRMAVVQFPTAIQANHAVLAKNRSFCLNSQIQMRLIQ